VGRTTYWDEERLEKFREVGTIGIVTSGLTSFVEAQCGFEERKTEKAVGKDEEDKNNSTRGWGSLYTSGGANSLRKNPWGGRWGKSLRTALLGRGLAGAFFLSQVDLKGRGGSRKFGDQIEVCP